MITLYLPAVAGLARLDEVRQQIQVPERAVVAAKRVVEGVSVPLAATSAWRYPDPSVPLLPAEDDSCE